MMESFPAQESIVERVIVPNRDSRETLVSEVMTPDPICAHQDTSIESALALMRSGGFRRLPVINRHDKLVGVLSLDDVLSLLCEEFVEIGELLKKQLPQSVVEQTS